MKSCSRCGEDKPLDHFSRDSKSRDGRFSRCKKCVHAYHAAWYQKNKERKREQNRRWKVENRAHYKAQQKEYLQRPEIRARSAEQMRRWRAANPERALATHRRAEANRDPHKRRDKFQRYKARLRNAPVVEKVDRLAVYERDNGICHICRRPCPRQKFTLDHLIPLIHGGDHTALNLRVAHLSCNSRRGPGRIPAQLILV